MESSGRRSHRDQGRKERHPENSSQRLEDPNQPKFGNLIPRSSSNNTDELRQFAKNVLGDYDSTMLTIQSDYGQQMSKLFGVERTQPITPITTTTSSFNIFEANMKDRINTTIEKREPVVPASFQTFGDRHRSNRKGNKQSPPGQSSFKNPDRTKPVSRSKVNPYVKPNHPLMTGVSSSSSEATPTIICKSEQSEHMYITKHPKKHKKNRNEQLSTKTHPDLSEGRSINSLGNIGKSASFTTNNGAVSPSNSEKGSSNSTLRTSFKRSNSVDNPAPSNPPVQTGHTSFSCYNPTTSTVEKKKDKKQRKTKAERDQMAANHRNLIQDSQVTVGHMTLSTLDTRNQPSKPSKLNFTSIANVEESTSDTADLQTMLKEMNSEIATLPSFLTPIHTPSLKQESPFIFASQANKHILSIKEESSLEDNPLLKSTHATVPTPLTSFVAAAAPATTMTKKLSTEEIIGTISSSDSSDSSDDSSSSESGETSSDEDDVKNDPQIEQRVTTDRTGMPPLLTNIKEELKLHVPMEENTSFMLDQINQQFNQSLNTLTPIKSSPLFPTHAFPLTDESANLSPAKLTRTPAGMINQSNELINIKVETSLGFQTISSSASGTLNPGPDVHPQSESDSSSSGEESDTESSDSEDETFVTSKHPSTSVAQNSYPQFDEFAETRPTSSIRQESRPFQFEYEDISQDIASGLQSPNDVLQRVPGIHDPLTNRKIDQNDVLANNDDINNKTSKKRKKPTQPSLSVKSPRLGSESSTGSCEANKKEESINDTPLMVKIPLWKVPEVQQKAPKPQAKVEPYCVSNRKRTSSSADSSTELPLSRREHTDIREDRYPSRGEDPDDLYGADHLHHHDDGERGHRDRRGWPNDYHDGRPSRRRGENERSGQSDRRGERYDRYLRSSSPHHGGTRDEYWDYRSTSSGNHGYDSRRDGSRRQYSERNHGNSSEYYYERARSLKREADAITGAHGTSKAIKYMQSVAFFMRHGFAQENEVKWDGVHTSGNNKAFKIYSDTVNLLKYSMKLGSDCKPLLVNCLRCHGVLLWKMYSLKQRSIAQYHKDLQDVFNTSKISQKSPNPSATSFSPLPSPASVGSTNSSCSGAGGAGSTSFNSSVQDQNIPVSKIVCNKVNEYLTLTGYVHQSIDLWKQAESMSEQYRDIFSIADRRIGHVTQFSPVAQIADWIDESLQTISSKWS